MKPEFTHAEHLCGASHLPRDVNVLVIASFPPSEDKSSHHAAKLVHMLSSAGGTINTAAGPKGSFARIALIYRSRRLFRQTMASISDSAMQADEVVIYPSGLGIDAINKPHRRSRRMEEWRRFRLAYHVAVKSKRSRLMFEGDGIRDKNFWLSLALSITLIARRPFRFKVNSTTQGLQNLVREIIGQRVGQPSELQAIKFLIDMVKPDDTANNNQPMWSFLLLQSADHSAAGESVAHDLRMLAQTINQLSSADGFPILDNLNHAKSGPLDCVTVAKLQLANTVVNGEILSLFQQHKLALEIGNGNLSRETLLDKTAFLDWYIHSAITRKSLRPLPVPGFQLTQHFAGSLGSGTRQDKAIIPALSGQWLILSSRLENAFHNISTPLGRMVFFAEIILDYAPRCQDLGFLPKTVMDYFAARIGEQENSLSKMEVLIAALSGKFPTGIKSTNELWNSQEIRDWYQTEISSRYKSLAVFSTGKNPPARHLPTPSVRIIGVSEGESGMARNAVMSAEALNLAGFTVTNRKSAHISNPKKLNRGVVLHHGPTSDVPSQMLLPSTEDNNALHIGFLLWELEKLPRTHDLAGKMLDEIWAPSNFVANIYRKNYDREVINIGKSISLPDVTNRGFDGISIPDNCKVFLMCFDAHSSVERKNPLAAVTAFLAAFPDDPDMRIIIKTTPTGASHWGDPNWQMRKINALARKDRRISVITKMLPFKQLMSLIKRADCLVSPHRAEGFGYMPAYALYYGTPVIVTDYSGTQDFCTPETAFPVANKMIEIRPNETIVPLDHAIWADIDVDDLALKMRQVIDHPDLAASKAAKGRELIHSHYSLESQAKRYRQRLVALGAVSPDTLP